MGVTWKRESPPAHRRPRRVPLTIWAVTALHVALLLAFSVLYPPFTGFDETQHVDAVLSIRHGDGWPAPQERELSEGIVAAATPVLEALAALPFSDDPLPDRGDRPSIASLGVERESQTQPLPNQITQHPPLYYAFEAAVLAAVPGSADWPFDRTVGVLRLLSVLLMAPLPLLAWATSQVLRTSPVVGVTAALLTVSVPQLQRVGSQVNNDAAYTLAFATALVLLARVAQGDLRRRTVLLSGAVVGLALLTKGFALVLPPAVALAFAVGGRRTREPPWWRAGLLALTVAFVVGGWWWLRNLLVFGAVQPAGWPQDAQREVLGLEPRPPGTPAPFSDFLGGAYVRLSERFWGGLPINYAGPDTFPELLVHLLVAGAALAVTAALLGGGRSRLPLLATVLVPFAGTLVIVGYGMWTGYTYSLDFPGAQGRYLFGSLPSLATAVALGLAVVAGPARRLLPALAALLALGMQGVGLRSVLALSWLPPFDGRSRADRYGEALDGIVRWAPWPPAVTLTVLVLTVVAAVVALAAAVRWAFVPDEAAPVRRAVEAEPAPEPTTV